MSHPPPPKKGDLDPAGADPGFSWGGGGGPKILMCAHTNEREAQSPLQLGLFGFLILSHSDKEWDKKISQILGGHLLCCAPSGSATDPVTAT